MSGHVPPPGAEAEMLAAGRVYLAAVQTALGTAHKVSVFRLATMSIIRVATEFGVSSVDIFEVLRDIERRLFR